MAKEIIEVAEMLGHNIVDIFVKKMHIRNYKYLGYLKELTQLKSKIDDTIIALDVALKQRISIGEYVIICMKVLVLKLLGASKLFLTMPAKNLRTAI